MSEKEVFLVGASRTAMGSYGGALVPLSAVELGRVSLQSTLEKSGIDPKAIEKIYFGNVLSANLGQSPARQVALAAGLPESVCTTNINKVCASGMKTIHVLMNEIKLGEASCGIAGGMESMSNVPHYLSNARFGTGYGNFQAIDGLAKDGLTDVYNQCAMGVCGDKTAEKYEISREEQDDFAEQSYRRCADAWTNGDFADEAVSVEIKSRKGSTWLSEDEAYKKANFEKMRLLKPAFSANGTVTAATSSPMSDGASSLLLCNEKVLSEHNLQPSAKIIAYAEAEHDPMFFTTAPIEAAKKALQKAGLSSEDIDYFEVNEAFAVVALAFMKAFAIPHEKLNAFGGAIAMGHPLGSSGSRIVVTLGNVLKKKKATYGLAAICNGGGGASALIIENIA